MHLVMCRAPHSLLVMVVVVVMMMMMMMQVVCRATLAAPSNLRLPTRAQA
jgi:hypothetical protein